MILGFYLMALLFVVVTGGDLSSTNNSGAGHDVSEVEITDTTPVMTVLAQTLFVFQVVSQTSALARMWALLC